MKKIEIFERFSKMKAIGEIENAMGIVSSRGADRPYILGVQMATWSKLKNDL